jgi:hypothetical protein
MQVLAVIILGVMFAVMLLGIFLKLIGLAVAALVIGLGAMWVVRKVRGVKPPERLSR